MSFFRKVLAVQRVLKAWDDIQASNQKIPLLDGVRGHLFTAMAELRSAFQSDLGAAGRESDLRERAPEDVRHPQDVFHDAPVGGANPLPDASTRDSAGQRRDVFILALNECNGCGTLWLGTPRCPVCGRENYRLSNREVSLA